MNSDTYDLIEENVHYFGGVPLVEYWNDENEMGDFEWVIPQIDGYDKLESDRLNDKEQFVDALLLLTGCVMDKDERGREPWKQLREDKALCLPDSTASATYLHNSMDENGNHIFRDNIVEDIHKLSMVPDLSDRNFAANASGVAMKYKLLGLEQLTRIKEQWFTEGLKARLKLFLNFLALRGFPTLDISDVRIELSRSLPANLTEIAENIRVADDAGAVSTETKVRMFHAGDDWTEQDIQDEIDRIQGEKNTADPMMQMGNVLFGDTSEQLDEQDEQDDREEQIEG